MPNARTDGEWIRCAKCGRKLGRTVGAWKESKSLPAIETKCGSCGTLNYIMVGKQSTSEVNIVNETEVVTCEEN